jgi:hypothetical protein
MTININLQWKSFKLDLGTVDAWMKANAGPNYCGLSANSQLQIHFTDAPGDKVVLAVNTYWDDLDVSSDEYKNYLSSGDRKAAAASAHQAAAASAKAKLAALGLSDAEIAALIG